MMKKSGLLFVSIISILLPLTFSCSPLVLKEAPAEDGGVKDTPAEADPEGNAIGKGTEDPANSGGMLFSISGLTSDQIESTLPSVLNYYELIAVNRDAPTVVEHADTWRNSDGAFNLSLPLIKNNTYYILLLGGNDGGGGGASYSDDLRVYHHYRAG
ncbi:MAG: hypothetical protein LBM77_10390 [Spirochaetaceae bacterium]|jgi:hypothetical protein|nr:hypothetical protein [Spirochaetaceae bacterium]